MKKGLTEIVCILDRSGSMATIMNDAIGGFNTFIEDQKKLPGDALVTIVLFDDQYDLMQDAIDIKQTKNLNENTFVPRGSTALLDAIGKTINSVGERLSKTPEDERPEKVLFAILTDGMENCSSEFPAKQIKEMIEWQKEKYNWEFVFLAANQDAILTGKSMGINANSCFNFNANSKGTRGAYANLTSYTTAYRNQ